MDYFYWNLGKVLDYKHTIRHELRHHFDRKFLLYKVECLKEKPAFNINSSGQIKSVNSSNYILKYLFNLRTEGFADFRRRFLEGIIPSFHMDSIDYNISSGSLEEKISFFYSCLELETENVVNVFDFLKDNPILSRKDWFENIYTTRYNLHKTNLSLNNTFSPNIQGVHLFNIIALAEIANEYYKENKKPIKFKVLFENDEIPDNTYKEISRKIVELPDLHSFYKLFYKSAKILRLRYQQLIVPPDYYMPYKIDG